MPQGNEFTPKGEDVIRTEVLAEVKEMGYDPESDDNKPLIDKMVKKELDRENERLDHHKKLSKAIEQKQTWRDKATKALTEDDETDDGKAKPKGDDNTQSKEIDTSNFVTKDDLKNFNHRQKYSYLEDEEYEAINAIAKTSGKSFEDTISTNTVAKTYIETAKANDRIAGATKAPSTRTAASQTETEADKVANELDRDLPVGFSSKR